MNIVEIVKNLIGGIKCFVLSVEQTFQIKVFSVKNVDLNL